MPLKKLYILNPNFLLSNTFFPDTDVILHLSMDSTEKKTLLSHAPPVSEKGSYFY